MNMPGSPHRLPQSGVLSAESPKAELSGAGRKLGVWAKRHAELGLLPLALAAGMFIASHAGAVKDQFEGLYIIGIEGAVLVALLATMKMRRCYGVILFTALPWLGFELPPQSAHYLTMVDLPILVIVALGSVAPSGAAKPNARRGPRVATMLLGGLLLSWVVIGFGGYNYADTFQSVARLLPVVMLPLALSSLSRGERYATLIMPGVFAALFGVSLFTIAQRFLGTGFTLYQSLNENVGVGGNVADIRYPGPMRDPQMLGQFLAVLLPLCAFHYWNRNRLISLLSIGTGAAALLLSGSRASLAGLIVGSAIAFLVAVPGSVYRRALFALSALVVCAVLISTSGGLLSRRFDEVSEDAAFRTNIWQESMKIFYAHPLVGIGWGNYQSVILDYYPEAKWGDYVYDQPESTYVKILVETGVLGSTVFAVVIGLSLARYGACIKVLASTPELPFVGACLGAYIAILIAFITVYSFDDRRIFFCFVFLMCVPFLYSERENQRLQPAQALARL